MDAVPSFLCAPCYWALQWLALQLRKFPSSPVHVLRGAEGAAAFLRSQPASSPVVIASEFDPAFDERHPWYGVLEGIAAGDLRLAGILSEFGVGVWSEAIRSRKVTLATSLQHSFGIARVLGGGWLSGSPTTHTVTQVYMSAAEIAEMKLTKPGPRPRYVPPLIGTDGTITPSDWTLPAFFGLPAEKAGEEGVDRGEYLRLASVIAAGSSPDVWAAGLEATGRQRLDAVVRAFRVAPRSLDRVFVVDCNEVGPDTMTAFLASGQDALAMLMFSAAKAGAQCLIVSMPIPGMPLQMVFDLKDQGRDLAQAITTLSLRRMGDGFAVIGELKSVVEQIVRFFIEMN